VLTTTVFVFGVLNIQWFGGYIEMVRTDKVQHRTQNLRSLLQAEDRDQYLEVVRSRSDLAI